MMPEGMVQVQPSVSVVAECSVDQVSGSLGSLGSLGSPGSQLVGLVGWGVRVKPWWVLKL